MMRTRFHMLIDALRSSAATRWAAVRHLRLQTRALLAERRLRRRRGSAPVVPPAEKAAADALEVEVLRVIERHPEGVRAVDIGNELGVDWRRVPAIALRLVERARIEQVNHEFYPVEKAS